MTPRAQALLLIAVILAVAGGLALEFRAEIDRWFFRDVCYGTGIQTKALHDALKQIDRQHIASLRKMYHDLQQMNERYAAGPNGSESRRAEAREDRRDHAADIERLKVSFRQRYGEEP